VSSLVPGLRYQVSGAVATIVLDRPDRKNAFTLEMVDAWAAALRSAAADDAVRCVLVTGAGDSFCSGVDLAVLADVEATPIGRKRMLTHRIHQVAIALDELDKPVVAVMRGVAVGAGLDMALLCDMRLGSPSVRMSEGYIKVGLVPGDGGTWLLPRLIGTPKALELLLTADFIDADTALRLGLLNHVYPDEELDQRALEFAERLCGLPPVQAGMIKRLVRQAERVDLRTHFDMVSSHFGVVTALDDYAEAQAAFAERRQGRFRGR
jgi:enoyl-CoA hydratase/carnithine racemase